MGWLSRAKKRYSSSSRKSSSSSRKKSNNRLNNALSSVGSKLKDSARDYTSSRNNRNSSSNSSTPSWQDKLNSYSKDHNAGYSEIERAKRVYEEKKRAGDMQGAEAAHKWANQVRDSMGVSNNYNRATGSYNPPKAQPTWQDKLKGYSSDKNSLNAELDRVKKTISSGSATNMDSAKKYLNQLNAIGDGQNVNDVIGGKYDNYRQINNQNDMQQAVSQRPVASSYSGKFADTINKAAKEYGLDPNLIASVITRESSFNPNATSKAGAGGLMQLMPGTARGLGVGDVYNASDNIMGGSKYLKQMIERAGGDINKALQFYNAGPNRSQIPQESINYSNNVLETFKQLTGQDYNYNTQQEPQKPEYERKLDSYVNDKELAMAERKRVIDLMNSGKAQDMGAASKWLKELDSVIKGGSVQDALNGKYTLPTNDNDYAMSLDQRSRLEYYKNNPDAYDAEVNRILDKLEFGEAENPGEAESWLNRVDWAKEGASIEDIVAGKYDNKEAYPEEEAEQAMGMNAQYESALSEKDQIIEELRKMIEEQPNYDEIYDEIMNTYNSQQQSVPDVPSYSEALKMAGDQLNPLYDDTLKGALKAVDNNNLQRGFFGQMPGAELERSTAVDIEGKRSAALANLANSLINSSRDYSQKIIDSNMRDQQNEMATLLKALGMKFDMKNQHMGSLAELLNYYDNREDKQFDKDIKESDLTGYYKGKMTTDYQKLLQEMGLKQEEAIREAEYNKARIEKIYNDAELGWEKLKNDDMKIAQAAQRIGISAANLKLSKEKYASSILEKSQSMASKYFKDIEKRPEADQYEKRVRYYADYLQGKINGNADDEKILKEAQNSGDLK